MPERIFQRSSMTAFDFPGYCKMIDNISIVKKSLPIFVLHYGRKLAVKSSYDVGSQYPLDQRRGATFHV